MDQGGEKIRKEERVRKMDDFSTYQGALDIFRKVNCAGAAENCIFGAIVDQSKSASFTGAMIGNAFGPAGYVVGGMIGQERDLKTSRIYEFFYVLFDFTEQGVGIMPLTGGGLRINPEKLTPCYDGFVFYYYQELAEVSFKNYYGIRKSVKTITIRFKDGRKLHFNANMVEKPLPYQENGMKKMVERYQK